jgi:hypothetical protein
MNTSTPITITVYELLDNAAWIEFNTPFSTMSTGSILLSIAVSNESAGANEVPQWSIAEAREAREGSEASSTCSTPRNAASDGDTQSPFSPATEPIARFAPIPTRALGSVLSSAIERVPYVPNREPERAEVAKEEEGDGDDDDEDSDLSFQTT